MAKTQEDHHTGRSVKRSPQGLVTALKRQRHKKTTIYEGVLKRINFTGPSDTYGNDNNNNSKSDNNKKPNKQKTHSIFC